MIATAGVGCDWKFDVKEGEVLIAEASSETFDASIRLYDEGGKLIKENDDRVEGDQSPLVIHRFSKAQKVRLNVGSFKNASGGRFEFRYRLMKSVLAAPGKQSNSAEWIAKAFQDGAKSLLVCFKATKGKTYAIDSPYGLAADGRRVEQYSRQFFGPSGVAKSDYKLITTYAAPRTFTALAEGDYFTEMQIYPHMVKVETRVQEVPTIAREQVGTTKYSLEAGQQIIVKFPVEFAKLLSTEVKKSGTIIDYLTGPEITKERENLGFGSQGSDWGSSETFTWFRPKYGSEQVVRAFYENGDATLVLTNASDQKSEVELTNRLHTKVFSDATNISENLGLGDCELYDYTSLKNDMMRLRCRAEGFRLVVEIFNYRGQVLNQFVDTTTNAPGDDLYFPNADRYFFRVSCVGNGGSGTYTLRRDPISTLGIAINEKAAITLDGKSFGIYSVELEANKRYTLRAEYPGGYANFMIMSEDGQVLPVQLNQFDNLRILTFTAPKAGKYRIWVRGGGNANVLLKLTPYKAPTIDD